MAKRKRRRKKRSQEKKTQRGSKVDSRALQIIQRKFGGRRPDRAKVLHAFLQESRRELGKSEYKTALELAERALQLAQSEDEKWACNSLLAEIRFARASSNAGQVCLDDLKKAVELAPEQPLYRIHLAHALEQHGRSDKALAHYQAVSDLSEDLGVGYLWSLAALEAGRPLPSVDLTPAEYNTLDIVQRLVSGDAKSVQLTKPLLDGSPPLWRALARMLADETTAPIKDLKTAIKALKGTGAAGIVHYYLGVAALRTGDLDTAWKALADAGKASYTSLWLKKNRNRLSRALAFQRAEEGDWRGVVKVGEPLLREADDRILAETVGLAYFHLGYEAAQADDWAAAARHWQHAQQYDSNRYLAQNLAVALEQQEDWEGAAEAWREMIRRRPRKKNHPDYLDDNQMAALWHQAAECYRRAGNVSEAITCLRNGLRCAPDDIEMRRELSEALMANEQFGATENELNRILKTDPDNVEALVRLGQLYAADDWWRSESKVAAVLKRALELDPDHREAREVLAAHYTKQGHRYEEWGMYDRAAEQYRQGLECLPDYGLLYVSLARAERHQGHEDEAREHLLKAYEVERNRTRTAGPVLHELLHLDAEEDVERLVSEIRQMEGLLPGFWINQGEQALECHLDQDWADRFFEEALAFVDRSWVAETKAEILVDIIMGLSSVEADTSELCRKYRKRIDREAPKSGAKELVEGLIALLETYNWDKAERLLRKARNKARKAGEEGLLDRIDAAEELLFTGSSAMYDIVDRLFG